MTLKRRISVDHARIHRWVIKPVPLFEKIFPKYNRLAEISWRIRIKWEWKCLYHGVDKAGKTTASLSTGYIGSHTAVVLMQSGHQVILLDNLANSSDEAADRIRQITGGQLTLIQADVRATDLLKEVLQKYHVDGVIHFAGLKAVGESVEMPIDYYANNV